MSSRIVIILHGLILALVSLSCEAIKPENVTDEEYGAAPAFCRDRLNATDGNGYTGPDAAYWHSAMGFANWTGIHHYCWAMIGYFRALRRKDGQREFWIQDAVGEIRYTISHATPDAKLLPEMYTKMAGMLVKLKKNSEAVTEFRKAAQLKPDYWPPYAGLADLYRGAGQINEARGVVEEGLKYSPESKTLNSMLADLQKSGAKTPPRKPESSQNRAPSKTPAPLAQAPIEQASAQQPEPSPAK